MSAAKGTPFKLTRRLDNGLGDTAYQMWEGVIQQLPMQQQPQSQGTTPNPKKMVCVKIYALKEDQEKEHRMILQIMNLATHTHTDISSRYGWMIAVFHAPLFLTPHH